MNEHDKAVRQKLLAEITKGYSAIVDGPGCFFIEDWVEMYPDAKVIPSPPLPRTPTNFYSQQSQPAQTKDTPLPATEI
jgi:hypothetical protein